MPSASLLRFVRTRLVSAALAAASLSALQATPARAADGWPAQVQATYDINFNGINVGRYDFASSQDGQTYKMVSNASLSILLGAIHWTGDTQATGKLHGETATPQTFGFNYKAQSKAGSTKMAFTGDTVTQVLQDPPPKIKEGMIPVEPRHLKGVLDPLSAVLALSHASNGNPCSKRIPVYDGTQRFDLVLSSKGQVTLDDRKHSVGYACRVKYVPIAGYKMGGDTQYMAESRDIEIILRPLPGTNVYVPHKVSIPTIAGPATLVARKVNVVMSTQQQFALQD